MNKYYFRTSEIGLTDNGIHFLRSGFNYKTVNFPEIRKADIKKGKELNNWVIIFVIGTILLIPGLYLAVKLIDVFLNRDLSAGHARMSLLFLIPAVGGYFIYSSLRTGTILQIYYGDDKTDKFPLRDIIKESKGNEFTAFMKDKLDTKLRVG